MATRTISTRLAIEGESQFKTAITSINSELKTLQSSLKVVESDYKGNANSLEALTKKQEALQNILELQKKKLEESGNAFDNAKLAQADYANQVDNAKKAIADTTGKLEALKKTSGDTAEEQKKLSAKLEEQKTTLTKAEAGYDAATKGVNDWQKALNYAKIDVNDTNRALETNAKYLQEARDSSNGFATSIDASGKELKEFSDAAEDAGEKTEKMEKRGSAAVCALADAVIASGAKAALGEINDAIKAVDEAFTTFEAGIAKIATIADTSVTSIDDISSGIRALSVETGQSTADISLAVYEAISSGVDTAKAVEFVSTATKLATGGFTSTTQSVDVLTTAINAYGLSASEASSISDMLVETQNLGKTTVDELAQSLGEVIPIAAAYGVGLDQLSASYAILTAGGIKTSEATTNIRGMLSELADSGSKVAEILKEQTGKSFGQLMSEGKSLGDIIEMLSGSVGGNSEAFANLFSNIRAGTGAVRLMTAGSEEYAQVLSVMQNSAGATSAAYDTMADTAAHAQARLTASTENFKIAVGAQVTPMLTKLREAGASVVEWATEIVSEAPWVVDALTAVAAAVSVIVTAFAGFTVWQTIGPRVIALIKALNVAMAANPALLIATAIAALIAALGALVLSYEPSTKVVGDHVKALKESKAAYDENAEAARKNGDDITALAAKVVELGNKTNKTAADELVLQESIGRLNEAVPNLGLAYDGVTGSLNKTSDAIINLAKAQAEAKMQEEQVDRLSELYVERAKTAEMLTEKEAELAGQSEHAIGSFEDFALVYKTGMNADEIAAKSLTETMGSLDEQISQLEGTINAAAVAEDTSLGAVDNMSAAIASLNAEYEAAYNSALESLNGQVGFWENMSGSVEASVADMQAALDSQVEYFTSYNANLKTLMQVDIPGVDMGPLLDSISDGTPEAAARAAELADAVAQGNTAAIAEIANTAKEAQAAKEELAATMGEQAVDYKKRYEEIVETTAKAVKDMDKSGEAKKAAEDTIQGYIDGAAKKGGPLNRKMEQIAQDAMTAFKKKLGIASPSKVFKEYGTNTLEGYIQGVEDKDNDLKDVMKEAAELAAGAFNNSLKDAQDTARELIAKYSDMVNSMLNDVDNRIDATEKKRDAQIKKLSEYGDYLQKVTQSWSSGEKLEYNQLTDLSGQISVLKEYDRVLTELNSKPIPDGLINEIVGMDVDDLIEYGGMLLSLTDKDFDAYMAKWNEKQQLSKDIANKFYSDELNSLETEYKDKLQSSLDGMKDVSLESGKSVVQGLIDGMRAKEAELKLQAQKLAAIVTETTKATLQIKSPSKVMEQLGKFTVQGFDVGLQEEFVAMQMKMPTADSVAIRKPKQADIGSMISSAVNAVNVQSGSSRITVEVPVNLNGREVARVIAPDLRAYNSYDPEVVSDRI